MWLTKSVEKHLNKLEDRVQEWAVLASKYSGEGKRLEIENTRLRADLDWFKLRLNAVEKERQQLIQAAIGVKIPIPEFTPVTENPSDMLNYAALPDLSIIGSDAPDDFNPAQELAADYSALPQRANN